MIPRTTLPKEHILQLINQEHVFCTYLHIPSIPTGFFQSPIRKDQHPSCSFKYINDRLYFRDWTQRKTLDCFDIVQELFGLSFMDALTKIVTDFDVDLTTIPIVTGIESDDYQKRKTNKQNITVDIQELDTQLKMYLSAVGITRKQTEKFKVFKAKNVYLNGKHIYTFTPIDPAIAYYFGTNEIGEQRWKIYFYTRTVKRFLCNTNRIAGWVQLPTTHSNLIITKSLKDVMLLDRYGIPAIAGQSEYFDFYERIIDELKQRFKQITILYDNDKVGIEYAKLMSKEHQLNYIIPPDKDLTDTFSKSGRTITSNFLKQHGFIK
jgi:hypothetical protein